MTDNQIKRFAKHRVRSFYRRHRNWSAERIAEQLGYQVWFVVCVIDGEPS